MYIDDKREYYMWCPDCGEYYKPDVTKQCGHHTDLRAVCKCGGMLEDIDAGIFHIIKGLNDKGYVTAFSCEGHAYEIMSRKDDDYIIDYPYVTFSNAFYQNYAEELVETFMKYVGPELGHISVQIEYPHKPMIRLSLYLHFSYVDKYGFKEGKAIWLKCMDDFVNNLSDRRFG